MCCLMLQLTLIASKCSLSISYLYLLPSSIVVFFRSTRSISSQILVHLFSLRVIKGPRTIKKLREREREASSVRRPSAGGGGLVRHGADGGEEVEVGEVRIQRW